MTQIRRTPVAVDGFQLDTVQVGDPTGVPIVLLHGFPATSATWSGVLPVLAAAGCWAVAPDQRGYSPGARPERVEDYATERLAADVLELVDALGASSFHLVGHDWGASVAWVVAALNPDRVASLTAVSVPHLGAYGRAVRDDPEQRRMSSYYAEFRRTPDMADLLLADDARRLRDVYGDLDAEHVETYLRHLSRPGALDAALSWYRAMTGELAELPQVTVPTTFVWSDADAFIGPVAARACHEFVGGEFRYVELEGVSHWVPEQRPHVVAAEILRLVARP
ncbi:alpha/beta fold hydrolase [Aeromicrobium sp. Leaf350]|uniref:alpha/beta fold hydrolase n=1 Tax=Aeromicrobium sp. Leaf350 TaxID=2876565 RepID=UPI001E29A46B|nr:alpha/beta hydrolase [Aeromicrobium sp. Leaf350]